MIDLIGIAHGMRFELLWVWEYLSTQNSSTHFFFSQPSDVARALVGAFFRGNAISDLKATCSAMGTAVAIGLVVAVAIGLLGLLQKELRGVLLAIAAMLAAMPILAVAPMFLIWFGIGWSMKVAIGSLLAALVFLQVLLRSERLVPGPLREFALANGFKRILYVKKIWLPLSVGAVLDVFPAAINAAFLGVFVGEFVAADSGVGFRILQAGRTYQTETVIAYAVITIATLIAFQGVIYVVGYFFAFLVQWWTVDKRVRRLR